MKKIIYSILSLLFCCCAFAQNVGIGTNTPIDKLEVNGNVRSNGLLITNSNVIELGVGITKQTDNGKIAYNAFGEANILSIVGGGTAADGSDRRIKFWANGSSEFTGGARFSGAVGIGTAASGNQLTVMNSNAATLSLQNSNTLNTGIAAGIHFGGSNYTTSTIQTIGNSSTNARLAFFTGYSFQGGVSNLRERITIANNGNIGINNTDPQQALDINGMLRFSGSTPAAFTLSLTGSIMYNTSFLVDSSEECKYIKINHPFSNNNPNAFILVTPIANTVPVGVFYAPEDGYWYMIHFQPHILTGYGTYDIPTGCNSGNCQGIRISSIDRNIFDKRFDKWNILIMVK